MSYVKKLTLKILTGQKFSLSVNFDGADSTNLKFAINLVFGINSVILSVRIYENFLIFCY